jgi:type III secretion protein D
MKQVRILTGAHAGAQLLLDSSSLKLGSGAGFDIDLDDWNHAPIELVVDQEGNSVSAYVLNELEGGAGKEFAGLLESFVPRRFLDIVLCCGPAEGEWPSDVSLLEQLMRPAPVVLPVPPKKAWRLWASMSVTAVALLGAFGVVVMRQSAAAQERVPQEALLDQVFRAVDALRLKGLHVSAEGEQVVVEGLLESPPQVQIVRAALARFPKQRLAHRYAAADQTARSIIEALGVSGLRVEYRGQGVFAVQGQAQDLPLLRKAAERVAGDLAPLVKGIQIEATALPPPDRVAVGSVMATDGLQVVETRDGAKYLTLSPLPVMPVVELVDLPAVSAR